jgi:hypothetical protein
VFSIDGDIPASEETAHKGKETPTLHDPGFQHKDSLPDVAFGLGRRQLCLLARKNHTP